MSEGAIAHVSDPVSWDELCQRFPDQWVVLVELDWTDDAGRDVRTAFVAGSAARSKRDAMRAARPLRAVFDELGCFHTSATRVPALPPILYTTAHETTADASDRMPVEAFAFA